MSFVLTCSTHGLTHEAKIGIESSVAKKIRTGTISQRNQLESTGIQQFLYSRAVGKDEVASSNLASSSNVVAKSALRPRFFYAKIAIRPLPCFSSPTQTHFVGLCVGISVKRILSRIRLFCAYLVLEFSRCFSPTHPPTHGRGNLRKYGSENGSNLPIPWVLFFVCYLLFNPYESLLRSSSRGLTDKVGP